MVLAAILLNTSWGQDRLLLVGARSLMSASCCGGEDSDGMDALQVFVCGSSSPLPDPGRAQACIALVTPEHFYIIDSGAGSTVNLMAERLPLQRLDGILLTHFHSDHIGELYELNLNSWVQGRPQPLGVYGPQGVDRVVSGVNLSYELDARYRVDHHGAELLPPHLGVLEAKPITAGTFIAEGDLKVTAVPASHEPVSPALGYKIEYKDRSVFVTGDSLITNEIVEASSNVDLLLSDALSVPIISQLAETATELGMDRNAKVLNDIIDYHASTFDVIDLVEKSNTKLAGFYHLVPPPRNVLLKKIFERDLPGNVILTEDRMWFILPSDGDEVDVQYP